MDPLLPKSPKIFTPLAKPFGYGAGDGRLAWSRGALSPRLRLAMGEDFNDAMQKETAA